MPGPLALNTRAKVLLITFLLIFVGVSVHRLYFAAPPGPYVSIAGRTMGTTWEVKVATKTLSPDAFRSLAASIQASLDRVNELMSTYLPDSEVSRFNALDSSDPVAVSPETMIVLVASRELSEQSGGAFDITVGPLVKAWGFGATDQIPQPPTPEELAGLRERVGYQQLRLDADAGEVRKRHPRAEIDLSAIAKGYAVDRVAETLEARGYHDYLIEVGGELRASGARLDGRVWRVGIERPEDHIRVVHEVIELANRSMATSGDYRNYYEEEGVRISHTIDPRALAPIRHRLASVTVLHESAMWADGLATMLNVLGPKAGYDLAVAQELAAYFIVREAPETFATRATPAFQAVLDASKHADADPPGS